MTRPAGLPNFQAPPLNEMAVGVQFMPCRGYNSLMATDVWNLFRSEYPTAQEQPSTPPNFELFGPVHQPINFGFVQGPVLNRFFFVSKSGDDVIQFQSDKLFHNWRRLDQNMQSHTYPRFEATFEKYSEELNILNSFFIQVQGDPISVNQAEVTYVNHIDISENPDPSEWLRYINPEVGKVEDFIGNFRRVLYSPDGKPEGRIICESNSATDHQGRQLIVMTLIVRGAPKGTGVSQALEFLRKSRETVVTTFAELTTDSAHKVWERTQ